MPQIMNFDDPITLYRDKETRVVHNKKEYDKATEEGFGSYSAQEYPRVLYNQDGKTIIVIDANDEKEKTRLGFQRKVILPKAATPAEVIGGGLLARLNDLEERVAAIESQLA